MNLPKASLRVGLCMVLSCPLAGAAENHDAQSTAAQEPEPLVIHQGSASGRVDAADTRIPAIQLAAAIGIVKPEPAPEPVPDSVPEPPAAVTAPPVAEQVEPGVADAETGEPMSVSRKQILIGAGVAALLGIVAGGGGGGSSSPTQH